MFNRLPYFGVTSDKLLPSVADFSADDSIVQIEDYTPNNNDLERRRRDYWYYCGNKVTDLTQAPDNSSGLQLCFRTVDQLLAFEGDLLKARSIRAMCSLSETVVRSHNLYQQICNPCLPDISLGNILAVLNGRSSCQSITDGDVSELKGRLSQCAQFYLDGQLDSDCSERRGSLNPCSHAIPSECIEMNAMYTIMNFLIDKDFTEAVARLCRVNPNGCLDSFPSLQYSILFLQARTYPSYFEIIYKDRLTSTVEKDGVTLVGFHFDRVAYRVFQDRLLSDVVYPAFSLVIVFIIVWIYTGTLFVTLLSMQAILSSLGIAYFLYTIVFGIDFFPFINVTAVIIMIGVGSDDVFVYMDTWKQTYKMNQRAPLDRRVYQTLRHAALSMFVTSFTTATAFFANAISPIVSIKCFGVYAGISVIVCYVLMITWLPAIVVISDKYISPLWERLTKGHFTHFTALEKIKSAWKICLEKLSLFYSCFVPWVVSKLHVFLIVSFVGLGIGMSVAVFHSPSLQLPSTSKLQLFVSSDILSTYDFKLAGHFPFELSSTDDTTMRIVFAFGPIPKDHSGPFDPSDSLNSPGPVSFRQSPMVIGEKGQLWLMKFCSAVKNQTFYKPGYESCFIEDMQLWLQQLKLTNHCSQYRAMIQPYADHYGLDFSSDCCGVTLPTNSTAFGTCIVHFIISRQYEYGPLFKINEARKDIQLVAIQAAVQSNQFYTQSFTKMDSFWKSVENWLEDISQSAPYALEDSWFTCPYYRLKFYDLQKSLSIGSVQAMGVSVSLAFAVLLLTTLNIIISIFAIVSIAGTLVSTVGTLVLLGWQLNILESIAISIAVGLSVDFAVHYGVAYRLCSESLRGDRTRYAMKHMGPATTMAALTTFVAGAMMMPSTILAYFQLGTFLMLIMFYSWLYANYFFLPLCYLFGPQNNFAQLRLPKSLDCYSADSEGTGSESAAGECTVDGPEMQEMTEPLVSEGDIDEANADDLQKSSGDL